MIGKAIDGEGEALLYVLTKTKRGGRKTWVRQTSTSRVTSKYELEGFDGLPQAVPFMNTYLEGFRVSGQRKR